MWVRVVGHKISWSQDARIPELIRLSQLHSKLPMFMVNFIVIYKVGKHIISSSIYQWWSIIDGHALIYCSSVHMLLLSVKLK